MLDLPKSKEKRGVLGRGATMASGPARMRARVPKNKAARRSFPTMLLTHYITYVDENADVTFTTAYPPWMKQRLPDLGVGCEGEHSNITLGVTPCVTLTRWCNALHSVLHSSQQCNGECNAGECNRATIVNKSIVINRNHEIITHLR